MDSCIKVLAENPLSPDKGFSYSQKSEVRCGSKKYALDYGATPCSMLALNDKVKDSL
jgi:hypothetical protein